MSQKDHIINAWKSERYRTSLTDAERDQLPAHPAGIVDLTDDELGSVAGGTTVTCTLGEICMSVIVSCVFTCGCTSGCNTPIFPCIPPMQELQQ
jgi:mersacidin/lichenicidin family type 2 lantibiotic